MRDMVVVEVVFFEEVEVGDGNHWDCSPYPQCMGFKVIEGNHTW